VATEGTPDTNIPTEKRIQGNNCKPIDINTHSITSVLGIQESKNNNNMDISLSRNVTY
jgi:hypothetical protein